MKIILIQSNRNNETVEERNILDIWAGICLVAPDKSMNKGKKVKVKRVLKRKSSKVHTWSAVPIALLGVLR